MTKEIENFVQNNIILNQSALVEHLFDTDDFQYEDIENMNIKKCSECGDDVRECTDEEIEAKELLQGAYMCTGCDATYGEAAADDLDASQEVFEWWLVSEYLARKLKERGEPVLENDYGTWWGRTTTGQAIAMDSVIEKIWVDANIPL